MESKMIGSKIAEARRKINMSQAQLAARLFISQQAVGKWERGESMPDILTLGRLVEIFGVDLNYFSASINPAPGSAVKTPISTGVNAMDNPGETLEKRRKRRGWDMSLGNWVDADFSGLKNLQEKFSSSNIQRCKFIDADLSELILKNNHVVSNDFSDADMSNSHIQTSHLDNNVFKHCQLKETEFSLSHIKNCDFSGANFTGATFKSSVFEKNTITNAVWQHSFFIAMQIEDIIFNGALSNCYFANCAFKKVTFQDVILTNTFFKNNSYLKRIQFIDCKADNISYAFLKSGKADVSGISVINK